VITTAQVIAWMELLPTPQLDAPLVFNQKPGPAIPETPHRLVTVTRLPGAGMTHEGIFDRPGFQVRVRGLQHDPNSTEADIFALDQAIRAAGAPGMVAGHWLTSLSWIGSGPGPLPGTPDNGQRTEYVVSYLFQVSMDQELESV